MSDFFLVSSRLGFRTWTPEDLAIASALWGDPEVTRFITDHVLDEAEILDRLNRELDTQRRYGLQYWPIFLLSNGHHAGCCGLRPRQEHPESPELGVHIASDCRRMGFAFEACSRVIEYAFGVLKCDALFAGHNPENAASRHLLTRLGFTHSHDEFYAPTKLMHPSYLLRNPRTVTG